MVVNPIAPAPALQGWALCRSALDIGSSFSWLPVAFAHAQLSVIAGSRQMRRMLRQWIV
jgi:hypothetical protein